ncbi:anhydro-N-acetylmuramic acid kinase [Tanticharoenia sakaeratensis]|uniref:Anhydro-N-acetylmuramic acid kinase n=1 Tax=Tanticharoenia sakaeratensis NBRC 103193 TaxID=1231623 RepID=A0A0D6MMI7_9PROT|nr:anhydro-N-acetylmuramic acid kinase [Tanticharoenia sakaeratensis]GAN54884.1 anhydro-N-acetylmuramic acid kinase [Tanticharoenia sakaeratensis NBRC 103193]GBQ22398.1 anhydro-N-acetylmuramic acid kinase [Tanticharoenia sakaeratensis NBRC 103193]
MMQPLRVIGLMSGTSLDGVDAAVIETCGERIAWHGPSLSLPYDPALRARARALLDRAATIASDNPEVRAIEQALTARHVEAVQALRVQVEAPIDLIGFHGQTIFHAPQQGRTWQIGDAARLSRETGLAVVHDFRSRDVSLGGEGAPLAPWYHAALLQGRPGPVAVLNIGGVANVTMIGADGTIVACDTGPGNALLDDWALRHTGVPYDRDGALAAAGQVHTGIVERLLADPFFAQAPPKSLDRQSFAHALAAVDGLSAQDGAATLAALSVEAVRRTVLPEAPREWYVCGGGRHNPTLMAGLRAALNAAVAPVEMLGWDGDALEAECFGFLAVRSLRGLPLSAPGITGAPDHETGGRLTCAGIASPGWLTRVLSTPYAGVPA